MSSQMVRHASALMAIPLVIALISFLTGIRQIMGLALFPPFFLALALYADRRPGVSVDVDVDRGAIRVGEDVELRVRIAVDGGVGVLNVNMFPLEGSREGEVVEIAGGGNSRVLFKGMGRATREYRYRIRFLGRGSFDVGRVRLSYRGLFGMSALEEERDMGVRVNVYPRLSGAVHGGRALRAIPGNPRATAVKLGPASTDFRDIRKYAPGDPYRFINWKASARAGELLVNEYEREGLRTVVFVIDTGPWMREGLAEMNPLEYGSSLVISFSRILLRNDFNVGLWSTSGGVRVVPTSGGVQLHRIMRATLLLRPGEAARPPPPDLLAVCGQTMPHIVYVTNAGDGSLAAASRYLCPGGRCLPSSSITLLDVVPYSIMYRERLSALGVDVDCVRWARPRSYAGLGPRVRAVAWDPLCRDVGYAVLKISDAMFLGSEAIAR